jgi:hypothetical protein
MTTTQTTAQLLHSLAVQIWNAETSTEYADLYLLARKTYYSEMDAYVGEPRIDEGTARWLEEIHGAWTDLLLVVKEIDDQNRFPVSNEGFVSFSDGSTYGGRRS